jgi:hypothetical protein
MIDNYFIEFGFGYDIRKGEDDEDFARKGCRSIYIPTLEGGKLADQQFPDDGISHVKHLGEYQ